MESVLSQIVRKRFSQVNEDVATDALAYILESSEAARAAMMSLLRGVVPDLPDLRFKTQQAEGAMRPDMCGLAGNEPRVYVENKFWAGLTNNQPVSYLERLAAGASQPTLLLVVAPAARQHTLWRELERRIGAAGMSPGMRAPTSALPYCSVLHGGVHMALASWDGVLARLESGCIDDVRGRNDIAQLRALCNSADTDAFQPVSRAELTDQRMPAFVLQMGRIIQTAVDLAVARQAVSLGGTRPQASWNRIGRYLWLSADSSRGAGAWFGLDFGLWRHHGTTPLWLIFSDTVWGRGREVAPLLFPWAARHGMTEVQAEAFVAIGLDLPTESEQQEVVTTLGNHLHAIATELSVLPPRVGSTPAVEVEAEA
jgi:hypothetical protein